MSQLGNVLKREPYNGCGIYSPDGTLMCRVSRRRVEWYVNRNLAEWMPDKPNSIRLCFQPQAMGHHDDPLYLATRRNICVVCGAAEELTRHHCIPQCFRRHFPPEYKEGRSHDVLVLCGKCHVTYEREADVAKRMMVPKGQMSSPRLERQKALSAVKALIFFADRIPEERLAMLRLRAAQAIGRSLTRENLMEFLERGFNGLPPDADPYAEYVASLSDLRPLIRWWREHFVATMNPKYLPEYWSVEGRYKDDAVPQSNKKSATVTT